MQEVVEEDRRPQHRLLADHDLLRADPAVPLVVEDLPERAVALDPVDVADRLDLRLGRIDLPQELQIHRAEARPDRAALIVGEDVAGEPYLDLGAALRLIAERVWVG